MKHRILLLAGTTEGRRLAEFFNEIKVETFVSVATEYGEELVEEGEYLTINMGRLDIEKMTDFCEKNSINTIVDSTHPYAVIVSENARLVSEKLNMKYIRVVRNKCRFFEKAKYVDSVEEAIEYLDTTEGNILLTTGSKDLSKFATISDVSRLYPRILAVADTIVEAENLGIKKANIICMQGPFSKEINVAMIRQLNIKYLVTKNSGKSGGYRDKVEAAIDEGVVPVIIKRPVDEGYDINEVMMMFGHEKTKEEIRKQVSIIGIGPGNTENLTIKAKKLIGEADVIIGARRMVRGHSGEKYISHKPSEIADYIDKSDKKKFAVLMSGDVNFFSGAKKLYFMIKDEYDTELVPGISSLVYFSSKIGVELSGSKMISIHGKDVNLVSCVRRNENVFAITDKTIVQKLEELREYFDDLELCLAQSLSYDDEAIVSGSIDEVLEFLKDNIKLLAVLYIHNPNSYRDYQIGIEDSEFIRGKAPMTKSEVRAVTMGALRLSPKSKVIDCGSGTGSVSIEMALSAYEGRVRAVDRNAECGHLIKENMKKFKVENIDFVESDILDYLESSDEVYTHAFIGGSGGKLDKILDILIARNEKVRVVINCITLETLSQANNYVKDRGIDASISQISFSRSKKIASYNMMMGENPIYIISFGG